MTPKQKIMHAIIMRALEQEYFGAAALEIYGDITAENIEDVYDDLDDTFYITDVKNEFREGQYETNISAQPSRYLEATSVAAEMPDGSWVGWTYWFGGGKHAEPEAVPWMEYAYNLKCEEKEQLMIVRTFEVI